MWVVAVLVGVWLFVAGPFWFWLVSSHPTLNSFKVTCASRHTQRPYPCQKKRELVGNWVQQTGDRELGTGNWGQGTGDRELELGTGGRELGTTLRRRERVLLLRRWNHGPEVAEC